MFDQLFNWIERLRAAGLYPFGLEEIVGAIEGIVQDIGDQQVELSVTRRLAFWMELVDQSDTQSNTVEAFQFSSLDILRVISSWRLRSTEQIVSDIGTIGVTPPANWQPSHSREGSAAFEGIERYIDKTRQVQSLREWIESRPRTSIESDRRLIEALVQAVNDIDASDTVASSSLTETMMSVFTTIASRYTPQGLQRAQRSSVSSDERDEIVAEARSSWLIKIQFNGPHYCATSIGKTIWTISSALECVPGVAVEIEQWGHGSLFAKLRVYIRNVWARDEVREVLDKGRDAAVNYYLDRPSEEVGKLKAEREKLKEETRLLKQKADANTIDNQVQHSELDVALKQEQLRAMRLENGIRAVELVERASSLVKDGLVSADKVSVDINELAYFLFDGQNIDKGEPMPKIEKAEDVIADDDIPSSERDEG